MVNFVTIFNNDRAYLEILGESDDTNLYHVDFIDLDTNEIEYQSDIKINFWSELKTSSNNMLIRVSLDDKVLFQREQAKKFNRVYIKFGSKTIGDTLAWIPYVEEYRKVNNVEVVVFTEHNYLFDKVYPNLIFTSVSDPNIVNDVDKKFRIDYGPELYRINGASAPEQWHNENLKFDNCVKYFDYRKQSLQSIAALILGLPVVEIVPKVNIPDTPSKIRGKYVVVAIQSTAQLKYWNNPFGWERLFDFLTKNGYKVVVIDKHKSFGVTGYFNQAPKMKNVIDKTGNHPLIERIVDIKHADMFIGLSSGLAWLSWAIGTPVVMISGFTKPWNEFQSNCIRVHNPNVCSGCWNNPDILYDASDWLFCPKKMDYICSKAIQPKDVVDAVKKLMR